MEERDEKGRKEEKEGERSLSCMEDIIKTKLFRHQIQALEWVCERESSDEFKFKGGVLNDTIASGKTLVMLSLISLDQEDGVKKTTLVLCPATERWTWETDQHLYPEKMKILIYENKSSIGPNQEIGHYDLVLTTYACFLSAYDSRLQNFNWWRVVLDQVLTDLQWETYFLALLGQRRWVLTRDPIEGVLLHFLIYFFHLEPDSERDYAENFNQLSNVKDLQILLNRISLRRTKSEFELPQVTEETCYVDFSDEERMHYDRIRDKLKALLSSHDNLETLNRINGDCIWEMRKSILRSCTIRTSLLESAKYEDVSSVQPDLLKKLQETLQGRGKFDCPICMLTVEDVLMTRCGHIFCTECILASLQHKAECPLCRRPLYSSDLFSALTMTTSLSTKMSYLTRYLKESMEQNPKSVVFLYFDKVGEILENYLKSSGFNTLPFDSLSKASHVRDVVNKFQEAWKDEPVVLIVTMTNCEHASAAFHLSAASRVYFMDPACSPVEGLTELVQCIGQENQLKVVSFVVENSIEEKMLNLREEKKGLIDFSDNLSILPSVL